MDGCRTPSDRDVALLAEGTYAHDGGDTGTDGRLLHRARHDCPGALDHDEVVYAGDVSRGLDV